MRVRNLLPKFVARAKVLRDEIARKCTVCRQTDTKTKFLYSSTTIIANYCGIDEAFLKEKVLWEDFYEFISASSSSVS